MSTDENETLIEAVREYPCVWDMERTHIDLSIRLALLLLLKRSQSRRTRVKTLRAPLLVRGMFASAR